MTRFFQKLVLFLFASLKNRALNNIEQELLLRFEQGLVSIKFKEDYG